MSIKDELFKIGRRIKKRQDNGSEEETIIDLDGKVEDFMKWNISLRPKYHNVRDSFFSAHIKTIRDLIEKIAVWYELRFPNTEIDRIFDRADFLTEDVNEIMFGTNPYISTLFGEESDVSDLDWASFYNIDVFIQSLSRDERLLLAKPKYPEILYLDPKDDYPTLSVTRAGKITNSVGVSFYTDNQVTDEEIAGMNVKDALKMFKDREVKLAPGNDLESAIEEAENIAHRKDEMLNCVMYRIIERGGKKFGPYRAFLFAKEFERNIDIPIMYAVDNYYDTGLRVLINEYLKSGGSKDLKCYYGYFSKESKDSKLPVVTVQDVLLTQNAFDKSFYTQEERELQERIVKAIASQIDPNKLKEAKEEQDKERVRQLRIQRKLERSRLRQGQQ